MSLLRNHLWLPVACEWNVESSVGGWGSPVWLHCDCGNSLSTLAMQTLSSLATLIFLLVLQHAVACLPGHSAVMLVFPLEFLPYLFPVLQSPCQVKTFGMKFFSLPLSHSMPLLNSDTFSVFLFRYFSSLCIVIVFISIVHSY